jgi:hypothetical protein
MPDEFDDLPPPPSARAALRGAPAPRPVARLAARLYGAAPGALRGRLLACLLQPLGTLAVAGVAAGAFGRWLHAGGPQGTPEALAEADHFSSQQLAELAGFVDQVSPRALEDFARLLTEQPLGLAGFSAAGAMLLLRWLRQRRG